MSKDKAMKLALEALENSVDLVREDAYQAEKTYGNYPTRQGKVAGLKVLADDHEKAITALQKALAEQALDKKAENARELGLDYEPAQQEPVAWMDASGDIYKHELWPNWNPPHTPLYTSPPAQQDIQRLSALVRAQQITIDKLEAQRTWVGLTDEEITDIWAGASPYYHEDDFARAIEAKLKEKNT